MVDVVVSEIRLCHSESYALHHHSQSAGDALKRISAMPLGLDFHTKSEKVDFVNLISSSVE